MRKGIFFVLLFVFILSSTPTGDTVRESYEIKTLDNTQSVIVSATNHDPIVITCNQDFIDQGYSGSGLSTDPYIIEGLHILNNSVCISISNTDVYFQILSCSVSAVDYVDTDGILLDNVTNGEIRGCQVDSHYQGIYLIDSPGCNVTDSIVSDNVYVGIRVTTSAESFIHNNTANQNTWYGISIISSDGIIVSNNTANKNDQGISLEQSSNSQIRNNTVCESLSTGIYLLESDSCAVESNIVMNNAAEGIWADASSYCNISYNTAIENKWGISTSSWSAPETSRNCSISFNHLEGNTGAGIAEYYSMQCVITNNTLEYNSVGVQLEYSTDFLIENNTAEDNNNIGFYVTAFSHNCSVISNIAINNFQGGICVRTSEDCKIINNTLIENGVFLRGDRLTCEPQYWFQYFSGNSINGDSLGYFTSLSDTTINCSSYGQIILGNCTDVTLIDCSTNNATVGVSIGHSNNCTLANSSMLGNRGAAIYLEESSNCTFDNNVLVENGVFLQGSFSAWQHTFVDNIVNEKNLGYFKNSIGLEIDASNYGQIVLANCSDSTVRNGELKRVTAGIQFGHCTNCTVVDLVSRENSRYGIRLEESTKCNLSNCVLIDNLLYGILLDSSPDCTIEDNTQSSNAVYGILVFFSDNTMIINNTVADNLESGIFPYYSGGCTVLNNTVEGNNGRGFEFHEAPYCVIENNTAQLNGEHGIFLYSSSFCDLKNNTAESNRLNGIHLAEIANCSVLNCMSIGNGRFGIHGWNIDNCTISDTTIMNNTKDGIILMVSADCYILNNTISDNKECGISINECDRITVEGNVLENNGIYIGCTLEQWKHEISNNLVNGKDLGYFKELTGIEIDGTQFGQIILADCEDVTVSGGKFSETSIGIQLGYCTNCTISGVDTTENTISGIRIDDSTECTITESAITLNNDYGIQLVSSHYTEIRNTSISLNQYGLYLQGSDYSNVTNNTLSHNEYGVYLDKDSDNSLLYSNTIGYNTVQNGYDNGNANLWDNGTQGNKWDDYDQSGIYHIPGIGNSVDNHPVLIDWVSPEIDSPADIEYEMGTTEHTIEWHPTDLNPVSYQVQRNGSIVGSGFWDGSTIHIDVDGLTIGVYQYTLIVVDFGGNSVSDTVTVEVIDTTAPDIDSLDDTDYELGTTGQILCWNISDLNPNLCQLYVNGNLDVSESWTGPNFTTPVDCLELGVFNYTLLVKDTSNNQATDTVLVIIIDSTNPEINSPMDMEYEFNSSDNHIIWEPTDLDPGNFTIYLDGEIVDSQNWDGSQITLNVDDLDLGEYNYTVVVSDDSGNTVEDTVFVHVVDTTSPTIDSPADYTYEVGTTGHNITWIPSDDLPASYRILRNGTVLETDSWNGSEIEIVIDYLSAGVYNYTIIVSDTSGNTAIDTVIVTVTNDITTTTTTTTTSETSTVTETTPTTTETTTPTDSQVPSEQMTVLLSATFVAFVLVIVLAIAKKKS
ncbi:MAG: hypothetical protein GF411_03680 [Candidatus Lokiarchaeota archaeon]|nr:hypothetical protein [Candidatus Lokiarchaeota archaeon]